MTEGHCTCTSITAGLPKSPSASARTLSSYLKLSGRKLLKVFFVGQLEFNHLLMSAENQDVLKHISVHHYLGPLSAEKTRRYIEHRLAAAGAKNQIFTPEAADRIAQLSIGLTGSDGPLAKAHPQYRSNLASRPSSPPFMRGCFQEGLRPMCFNISRLPK